MIFFKTIHLVKSVSRGVSFSSLILIPLLAPFFFIIFSQEKINLPNHDLQVEVTRNVIQEDFSRFKPKKVFSLGLYIDDIENIRVTDHLYQSRFVLWAKNLFERSTNERSMLAANEFTIVNAGDLQSNLKAARLIDENVSDKEESEDEDAIRPYLYVSHEVEGDLKNRFYLRDYPFDVQTLRWIIEPRHFTAADMILDVDPNSALSSKINLGEWQIISFKAEGNLHVAQSDYSDPALIAKGELWNYTPRVVFEVKIKRNILSQLFKVLLPLAIIMLIAYSNYFVDPSRFDARFGISITAILSITALHLAAVSQLPGIAYLTAMDEFFLCTYSLILIVGIESVISSRFLPEEDADNSEWEKVYQLPWFRFGIPALRIIYPVFLSGGWYWIAFRASH